MTAQLFNVFSELLAIQTNAAPSRAAILAAANACGAKLWAFCRSGIDASESKAAGDNDDTPNVQSDEAVAERQRVVDSAVAFLVMLVHSHMLPSCPPSTGPAPPTIDATLAELAKAVHAAACTSERDYLTSANTSSPLTSDAAAPLPAMGLASSLSSVAVCFRMLASTLLKAFAAVPWCSFLVNASTEIKALHEKEASKGILGSAGEESEGSSSSLWAGLPPPPPRPTLSASIEAELSLSRANTNVIANSTSASNLISVAKSSSSVPAPYIVSNEAVGSVCGALLGSGSLSTSTTAPPSSDVVGDWFTQKVQQLYRPRRVDQMYRSTLLLLPKGPIVSPLGAAAAAAAASTTSPTPQVHSSSAYLQCEAMSEAIDGFLSSKKSETALAKLRDVCGLNVAGGEFIPSHPVTFFWCCLTTILTPSTAMVDNGSSANTLPTHVIDLYETVFNVQGGSPTPMATRDSLTASLVQASSLLISELFGLSIGALRQLFFARKAAAKDKGATPQQLWFAEYGRMAPHFQVLKLVEGLVSDYLLFPTAAPPPAGFAGSSNPALLTLPTPVRCILFVELHTRIDEVLIACGSGSFSAQSVNFSAPQSSAQQGAVPPVLATYSIPAAKLDLALSLSLQVPYLPSTSAPIQSMGGTSSSTLLVGTKSLVAAHVVHGLQQLARVSEGVLLYAAAANASSFVSAIPALGGTSAAAQGAHPSNNNNSSDTLKPLKLPTGERFFGIEHPCPTSLLPGATPAGQRAGPSASGVSITAPNSKMLAEPSWGDFFSSSYAAPVSGASLESTFYPVGATGHTMPQHANVMSNVPLFAKVWPLLFLSELLQRGLFTSAAAFAEGLMNPTPANGLPSTSNASTLSQYIRQNFTGASSSHMNLFLYPTRTTVGISYVLPAAAPCAVLNAPNASGGISGQSGGTYNDRRAHNSAAQATNTPDKTHTTPFVHSYVSALEDVVEGPSQIVPVITSSTTIVGGQTSVTQHVTFPNLAPPTTSTTVFNAQAQIASILEKQIIGTILSVAAGPSAMAATSAPSTTTATATTATAATPAAAPAVTGRDFYNGVYRQLSEMLPLLAVSQSYLAAPTLISNLLETLAVMVRVEGQINYFDYLLNCGGNSDEANSSSPAAVAATVSLVRSQISYLLSPHPNAALPTVGKPLTSTSASNAYKWKWALLACELFVSVLTPCLRNPSVPLLDAAEELLVALEEPHAMTVRPQKIINSFALKQQAVSANASAFITAAAAATSGSPSKSQQTQSAEMTATVEAIKSFWLAMAKSVSATSAKTVAAAQLTPSAATVRTASERIVLQLLLPSAPVIAAAAHKEGDNLMATITYAHPKSTIADDISTLLKVTAQFVPPTFVSSDLFGAPAVFLGDRLKASRDLRNKISDPANPFFTKRSLRDREKVLGQHSALEFATVRYPHDQIRFVERSTLFIHCLRRVTSDNVHQYNLTLRSAILAEPVLVISKLISQAIQNDDHKIIFCQAQLLQGVPRAILRIFVVMTLDEMFSIAAAEKAGTSELHVKLLAALIAFVWAQNSSSFGSLSFSGASEGGAVGESSAVVTGLQVVSGRSGCAAYIIRRMLRALQRTRTSTVLFVCELLQSLLQHMLHEPLESEEKYTHSQLNSLTCLPTSRWFASSASDSFIKFKWFDPQTMLLKKATGAGGGPMGGQRDAERRAAADDAAAFGFMSSVFSTHSNFRPVAIPGKGLASSSSTLSSANGSTSGAFSYLNFIFSASFTPLTLYQCRVRFCDALAEPLDLNNAWAVSAKNIISSPSSSTTVVVHKKRDTTSLGEALIGHLTGLQATIYSLYTDYPGASIERELSLASTYFNKLNDLVLGMVGFQGQFGGGGILRHEGGKRYQFFNTNTAVNGPTGNNGITSEMRALEGANGLLRIPPAASVFPHVYNRCLLLLSEGRGRNGTATLTFGLKSSADNASTAPSMSLIDATKRASELVWSLSLPDLAFDESSYITAVRQVLFFVRQAMTGRVEAKPAASSAHLNTSVGAAQATVTTALGGTISASAHAAIANLTGVSAVDRAAMEADTELLAYIASQEAEEETRQKSLYADKAAARGGGQDGDDRPTSKVTNAPSAATTTAANQQQQQSGNGGSVSSAVSASLQEAFMFPSTIAVVRKVLAAKWLRLEQKVSVRLLLEQKDRIVAEARHHAKLIGANTKSGATSSAPSSVPTPEYAASNAVNELYRLLFTTKIDPNMPPNSDDNASAPKETFVGSPLFTAVAHDVLCPRTLLSTRDSLTISALLETLYVIHMNKATEKAKLLAATVVASQQQQSASSGGVNVDEIVKRGAADGAEAEFNGLVYTYVTALTAFIPSYTDAEARRAATALQRILVLQHNCKRQRAVSQQLQIGGTAAAAVPAPTPAVTPRPVSTAANTAQAPSTTVGAPQGLSMKDVLRNVTTLLGKKREREPTTATATSSAEKPSTSGSPAPVAVRFSPLESVMAATPLDTYLMQLFTQILAEAAPGRGSREDGASNILRNVFHTLGLLKQPISDWYRPDSFASPAQAAAAHSQLRLGVQSSADCQQSAFSLTAAAAVGPVPLFPSTEQHIRKLSECVAKHAIKTSAQYAAATGLQGAYKGALAMAVAALSGTPATATRQLEVEEPHEKKLRTEPEADTNTHASDYRGGNRGRRFGGRR